jgi:hypothetical protein
MMSSKQVPVAATLVFFGMLISAPGVPALAADAAPPSVNAAPATDATWKSIDGNVQKLDTLIRAGNIGDLGEAAYGIANAVETLPKKSAALPPDQLAKVTASVKTVGSLATKVDKAGDKNDKAGVESTFNALKDALASLRAIYFKPASK